MIPEELLNNINSPQDFLNFLIVLRQDRMMAIENEKDSPSSVYGFGHKDWENGTIESFLDAMHAWAQDSGALTETPTWRLVAQLLLAAKSYE